MDLFIQNLVLGISIAAPLGPASIAIVKSGVQGGFLSALKVALGVVSADLTYVFVAYFGLAQFITIPLVKMLILTFGMLALGYLGYRTMQGAFTHKEIEVAPVSTTRGLFLEGYVVNISNPLAVVWWLSVIGSILATSAQATNNANTLLATLTIVVGILIWHTWLSILSHYGRKWLNTRLIQVISLVSGLVLLAFALRFGYQAFRLLR